MRIRLIPLCFRKTFHSVQPKKFSILVNLQLTSGLYVPRPGVFAQAIILRQVFWLVPLNHLPDKQCLSVVINGLRNNGTYSSGHCGRFSQPSLLAAPHGGRTVFRLQIYDNIRKPQIFQRIIFRKLLAALIHIKKCRRAQRSTYSRHARRHWIFLLFTRG